MAITGRVPALTPALDRRRPDRSRRRARPARPSGPAVGSLLASECTLHTPRLTIFLLPFRRAPCGCACWAVMVRVGGRSRRGLRVAAVLAAVAVAVAPDVVMAVSVCPPIRRYTTACDRTDGLLLVSPFEPATGEAANCRGYCLMAAVTVRPRPCVFCTVERCEKGVDLRGDPIICCDENACSAACGAPDNGCRYVGEGRTEGAGGDGGGRVSLHRDLAGVLER